LLLCNRAWLPSTLQSFCQSRKITQNQPLNIKTEILPSKFWRWAIFNLKKNRHFARKKGFHFLKMKKGLLAL
jgi:hypothetical protein